MNPVQFGKMIEPCFKTNKHKTTENPIDAIGLSALAIALAGRGVVSLRDMQAAFLGFMIVTGMAKPKQMKVPTIITVFSLPGNEGNLLHYGRRLLEKLERNEDELLPVKCKVVESKKKGLKKTKI